MKGYASCHHVTVPDLPPRSDLPVVFLSLLIFSSSSFLCLVSDKKDKGREPKGKTCHQRGVTEVVTGLGHGDSGPYGDPETGSPRRRERVEAGPGWGGSRALLLVASCLVSVAALGCSSAPETEQIGGPQGCLEQPTLPGWAVADETCFPEPACEPEPMGPCAVAFGCDVVDEAGRWSTVCVVVEDQGCLEACR